MAKHFRYASFLAAIAFLAVVAVFTAQAAETEPYKLTTTLKVGGEGGWDYATLDDKGERLFLTRTSHSIVVDAATGKTLGDIPKGSRTHGVALVPAAKRGFVSNGQEGGSVTIFDLQTYEVLGKIAAANDADGIIYDPASGRVLISCGDANVLIAIAADVDPKTGKAESLALGGKPEFLVADGQGRAYVNLTDKNEVVAVDTKALKVVARWSTAPGGAPTGLSMDRATGRLFVGCRNQKMIVMSVKDGSILADLPIGVGVDATAFDNNTALASCADGTLWAIRETAPGKFATVQTLKTAPGAKTMAVDGRTGRVYLPTADMQPAAPGARPGRPTPIPGTFKVLVVDKAEH
ncbi:MAG: YncE family protein [Tepidisphaerales bacterium]